MKGALVIAAIAAALFRRPLARWFTRRTGTWVGTSS